jgi:hypothetical protein
MPLKDGDPADRGDVWLRNLIESKWILDDGTVSANAFKSKKFIMVPDPACNRLWQHETSGRLRSKVTDIDKEGEAFCKLHTGRDGRFGGVMYASVATLARDFSHIKAEVVFTPNDDLAHADIAFYRSKTADLDSLRDQLQALVKGARRSEYKPLDALMDLSPDTPRQATV